MMDQPDNLPSRIDLRAVGPVGVPSYADPQECRDVLRRWDGTAQKNRELYLALLDSQMKAHLLCDSALLFSDGFWFDNPMLWRLVTIHGNELIATLTGPSGSPDVPALILQRDRFDSTSDALDAEFQAWLCRREELVSSALDVPGLVPDPKAAHTRFHQLRTSSMPPTIDQYAREFGLTDLTGAIPHMRRLFCGPGVPKPDRHHALGRRLQIVLRQLDLSGASGQIRDQLERCIDLVDSRVANARTISRSDLRERFPELWDRYSPTFNSARQRAALDPAVTMYSHAPHPARFVDETWHRMWVDEVRQVWPKVSVALADTPWALIRSLRLDPSFREMNARYVILLGDHDRAARGGDPDEQRAVQDEIDELVPRWQQCILDHLKAKSAEPNHEIAAAATRTAAELLITTGAISHGHDPASARALGQVGGRAIGSVFQRIKAGVCRGLGLTQTRFKDAERLIQTVVEDVRAITS